MSPDSDDEFDDIIKSQIDIKNKKFSTNNDKNEINESYLSEKYEKPKKPLSFPWWCRIIALCLSWVCMAISCFFIIVRGLEFGNEKVIKWVTSLVISFFASVFVTQPIQTLGIAVILSIIFRKFTEDLSDDKDDDGKSLNDYAKWQHVRHRQKVSYKMNNDPNHILSQLTAKQLRNARIKRVQDIKRYRYLRDILINIAFIVILFLLAYQINGERSYDYQNSVGTVFNKDGTFEKIIRVEDFYNWSINILAPSLRVKTYYNNRSQAYYMAGFLSDFSSRLLGFATLRQVRVENKDCKVLNQMANTYGQCYPEANLLNVDKKNYDYAWKELNTTYEPPNGMGAIYNAFKYQTSEKLKGSPYQGTYATYGGGGHVYELRGELKYLIGNLTLLQKSNWIDKSTRAVFIEFSAYNPNINLFVVTTMLLEILPSGTFIPTAKFECISLMETGNPSIKIALMVIYMLFVIYFSLKAIKQFIREGWSYWKGFWTYIDLLLIIFSFISLQMFILRIEKAAEISRYFVETKGYSYIKLQDVNLANQLIVLTLSCCCAFQTIKFLQLFRFNNSVYMLALTLHHCVDKLAGFMLVFLIIWLAFVQLMYLFFNEKSTAYSNLLRSMLTSFQILLGKFEMKPLLEGNPLFGSILFTSYNITIVLMLMNTFISIICDSFEAVRQELAGKPNDFEVMTWMKKKFAQLKRLAEIKKNKIEMPLPLKYVEEGDDQEGTTAFIDQKMHMALSQRVDGLINMCSIVSLNNNNLNHKIYVNFMIVSDFK